MINFLKCLGNNVLISGQISSNGKDVPVPRIHSGTRTRVGAQQDALDLFASSCLAKAQDVRQKRVKIYGERGRRGKWSGVERYFWAPTGAPEE